MNVGTAEVFVLCVLVFPLVLVGLIVWGSRRRGSPSPPPESKP